MSDFRHIAQLDVAEVAAQIDAMQVEKFDPQRDLTFPSLKHKTILLRCHDRPDLANWLEDLPVENWPILQNWTAMQSLLATAHAAILADPHFASRIKLDAPMGRVALSVIDPHGFIQIHTDLGLYAKRHRRFHIPLVTGPDAIVYARAEQVRLPPGALTWLNVDTDHWAGNWNNGKPRTHAVFELRAA